MGKGIVIILLFLGGFSSCFGQFLVTGKVRDTANVSIEKAAVLLIGEQREIKAYAYTDTVGRYELSIEKTGQYQLVFSGLGFQSDTLSVSVHAEQKKYVLQAYLQPKTEQLKTVLIDVPLPVVIKEDTVSFKTEFFTDGSEQTVEDVLEKIPGLRVLDDGTIKVGNQEISQVRVEDDDFFGRGYKMLTKNMPAYPIAEVEVLRHFSENKLLKDLENSDAVALNLKLDKSVKHTWFGNLTAAGGTGKSASVKTNVMNFGQRNKYYFLGHFNTIGQTAVHDLADILNNASGDRYFSVGQSSAFSPLDLSPDNLEIDAERSRFNSDKLVSLNAIFNPTKTLKVKPLLFLNTNNLDWYRQQIEQVIVGQTAFENRENRHFNAQPVTGFGKLEITYSPKANQILKSYTQWHQQTTDKYDVLTFNDEEMQEKLSDEKLLFEQRFDYTYKLDEQRVLMGTARYKQEKLPQNYQVNQFVFQALFPSLDSVTQVKQSTANHAKIAAVEGVFLNRFENGDLFEFHLGYEAKEEEMKTALQLQTPATLITPGHYKNALHWYKNDAFATVNYSKSWHDWAFSFELAAHHIKLDWKENHKTTTLSKTYLRPKLGVDWHISNSQELKVTYAFDAQPSPLSKVFARPVLSGYRSFYQGTGQFLDLSASTAQLYYQLGNWTDRFFAHAMLVYKHHYKFYSTQSIVNENYTFTKALPIKNRELFTGQTGIDYYFKAIDSDLKLNFGYTEIRYKNKVNTSNWRSVRLQMFDYGFTWRTEFSFPVVLMTGVNWQNSRFKTTLKRVNTTRKSFVKVEFQPHRQWHINTEIDRYYFGDLASSPATTFVDFEVTYQWLQDKLTLGFVAKNLLDTTVFNHYTLTDIGSLSTQYRLLPRMLMLRAEYRF